METFHENTLNKLYTEGWKVHDENRVMLLSRRVNHIKLGVRNSSLKWAVDADLDLLIDLFCLDELLRASLFSGIRMIEDYLRSSISSIWKMCLGEIVYRHQLPRMLDKRFLKNNKHLIKDAENKGLLFDEFIEATHFSQLRTLYEKLPQDHRKIILEKLDVTEVQFIGWLKILRLVRNDCAHHSPLWFQRFHHGQSYVDGGYMWRRCGSTKYCEFQRCFYVLLIISYWEFRALGQQVNKKKFRALLETFPEKVKPRKLFGFDEEWKKHPIMIINVEG